MKRFGQILLSFLLLPIVLLVLLLIYNRVFEVPHFIRPGLPDIEKTISHSYFQLIHSQPRHVQDVNLLTRDGDTIRFAVSLPANIPAQGLPTVVILGGLEIGRESLQYIPNQGANAVIAYEYPYSQTYWYHRSGLGELIRVRRAVLKVPAQISVILRWVELQPWYNQRPSVLLGYSFGAMFIPAAYHMAQANGLAPAPVVIAYGGADIYRLLRTNLFFLHEWQKIPVAFLFAEAIRPIEPTLHTSIFQTEVLLINGLRDQQIPRECARKLQQAVPEPKTIIELDEGHMNPDNPALTFRLVNISREWLLRKGAIHP